MLFLVFELVYFYWLPSVFDHLNVQIIPQMISWKDFQAFKIMNTQHIFPKRSYILFFLRASCKAQIQKKVYQNLSIKMLEYRA